MPTQIVQTVQSKNSALRNNGQNDAILKWKNVTLFTEHFATVIKALLNPPTKVQYSKTNSSRKPGTDRKPAGDTHLPLPQNHFYIFIQTNSISQIESVGLNITSPTV